MSDAGPFPQTTSAPRLPKPKLFPFISAPSLSLSPHGTRQCHQTLNSPAMQRAPPPQCQRGFPKCPPFPGLGDNNAATTVPTSTAQGSVVGTQEPAPVPASLHVHCGAAPHFSAVRTAPAPTRDLPAAPRFLLKAPNGFGPQQHPGRNPAPGHGSRPERGGMGHPTFNSSRVTGHPASNSSRGTPGGETWLFGSNRGSQHITLLRGEQGGQGSSSGCSHASSTVEPPRSMGVQPGWDSREGEEQGGPDWGNWERKTPKSEILAGGKGSRNKSPP